MTEFISLIFMTLLGFVSKSFYRGLVIFFMMLIFIVLTRIANKIGAY